MKWKHRFFLSLLLIVIEDGNSGDVCSLKYVINVDHISIIYCIFANKGTSSRSPVQKKMTKFIVIHKGRPWIGNMKIYSRNCSEWIIKTFLCRWVFSIPLSCLRRNRIADLKFNLEIMQLYCSIENEMARRRLFVIEWINNSELKDHSV